MKVFKSIGAFFVALVLGYITASVFISIGNMGFLSEMSVPLPVSERISVIAMDLAGLLFAFAPLMTIALLVGLTFTRFVITRWAQPTVFLYGLAGFIAMLSLHLIMKSVFGISPVAATRTISGLVAQGIAGGLAGWAFYRVNRTNLCSE